LTGTLSMHHSLSRYNDRQHIQGSIYGTHTWNVILIGYFYCRFLHYSMRIKCNNCQSDNLDQGTDDKILCHDCKAMYYLVAAWQAPDIIRNIEQ